METRWVRRLGPCIAALGAVAAIASTTAGAPPPIWDPPDCPGRPSIGTRPTGAWFRLDPTVSGGTYIGQRLTLGTPARTTPWRMQLDPESFAAEPRGGRILVGNDDGHASALSLIDPAGGCRWSVGTSRDVIRGAITTPDGTAVIEHRVDRRSRADLGVWRRPLDGSAPIRLLPPIDADHRFGPTWITELAWSEDGASLVLASCGEVACRYRVAADAGDAMTTIADPTLGSFVGMAEGRLVVREACRGLPCPIISRSVMGGAGVVLHPSAGAAVMSRDSSGRSVVVHERDGGLRTVRPDGSDPRALAGAADGLKLVPRVSWSGSGAEHPADRVLFGPDGRVSLDGSRTGVLRSIDSDVSIPRSEVLP